MNYDESLEQYIYEEDLIFAWDINRTIILKIE